MTDTHNVQQSPPRLPKLTPLPVQGSESIREWNMNLVAWIYGNWDDIESIQRIIAAQDEPSPALAPKVGDVVTAEVAVTLPVDSEIRSLLGGGYFRKVTGDGWLHIGGRMVIKLDAGTDWVIERIGPGDEPHPTNCACPDCEPDEATEAVESCLRRINVLEKQVIALMAKVTVLESQSTGHFNWLIATDARLDALEQPKQEPVAEPSSAPPSDICEKWADAIRHAPGWDIANDLRRLGLAEMRAVVEAVRLLRRYAIAGDACIPVDKVKIELPFTVWENLMRVADALTAKEKADGTPHTNQ